MFGNSCNRLLPETIMKAGIVFNVCVCVFSAQHQLGRTYFPHNVSFIRIGVCVRVCARL